MRLIFCLMIVLIVAISNLAEAQDTSIFPKGGKAPADRFTGTVWIYPLIQPQDSLDCVSSSVTFEPGARTNWHMHPGGQALLVIEGKGYYQERGTRMRTIQKGDVVKCPPGVEHWHGASPDTKLTHIAIVTNAEKGNSVWLQKVTDKQYHGLE
ncbi:MULTISPECIES: (R)-mandelonitrile lyase [Niastella]|nr:cupin domain-containing protein [Niastella soli]